MAYSQHPPAPYLTAMRADEILLRTPAGVCCKPGDFHIDPTQPVDRALITHAHADHARPGHGAVLATQETLDLMRLRHGDDFAGSEQATATARASPSAASVSLFILPATCSARRRSRLRRTARASSLQATISSSATPRAWLSSACPATSSSRKRRSDCRYSVMAIPTRRSPGFCVPSRSFPSARISSALIRLGKAQRLIALVRQAGYDEPIYLHGALEKITEYYQSRDIALGRLELVRDAEKSALAGAITLCPPSALNEVWSRRFPDPVRCLGLDAGARPRAPASRAITAGHFGSRRLGGLTGTIAATGADEIWVTHGQEDALVHWSITRGLRARPLDIVGYEDEQDGEGRRAGGRRNRHGMKRFAALLDRLSYEPSRNNKLRLMMDYFATTHDPERGWALAALTGGPHFPARQAGRDPRAHRGAHRPGAVRAVLRLCRRSLGDRRLDVAGRGREQTPHASAHRVVAGSPTLGKTELPARSCALARSRSTRPAAGRCSSSSPAALRIGISARLAKTAAAALRRSRSMRSRRCGTGSSRPTSICSPGSRAAPASRRAGSGALPPVLLAHPIEDSELVALARFRGRVEMGRHPRPDRPRPAPRVWTRLYSRAGDDISAASPTSPGAHAPGVLDGELLVARRRRCRASTRSSSGSGARPSRQDAGATIPPMSASTTSLFDGAEDLRALPLAERRRTAGGLHRPARPSRSISRR